MIWEEMDKISPEDWETLRRFGILIPFYPDDRLFWRGNSTEDFLIIASGEVELIDEHSNVIQRLCSGMLLSGLPPSQRCRLSRLTPIARTSGVLIKLNNEQIAKLIDKFPSLFADIFHKILHTVSHCAVLLSVEKAYRKAIQS